MRLEIWEKKEGKRLKVSHLCLLIGLGVFKYDLQRHKYIYIYILKNKQTCKSQEKFPSTVVENPMIKLLSSDPQPIPPSPAV